MKKTIPWLFALLLFCFSGCQEGPSPEASLPITIETTVTQTQQTQPAHSIPTETTTPEPTVPTGTTPPETQPTVTEQTQPTVTVPPETQPHVHEYRHTGSNEPTCTEEGFNIQACSCGATYTETTDALGHAWCEWVVLKEPTYTEWGEEAHTCSRCGETESCPIFCLTKKLTGDDWQEIARLTLQYINEIRNAQGACAAVEMPGCTRYAKARSEQMAAKEKVEHNYWDSITAATQLQYGRYIDPTLYGMEGEPYYQVYGDEAVGNGYGNTVEEVARCLAEGVSNSPQHWNYVGSDKNGYMSIGVTLNNGYWYCCIITSPVNLDENPLGY